MKTFLSPYISSLINKPLLSVIAIGNSNNYVWHRAVNIHQCLSEQGMMLPKL